MVHILSKFLVLPAYPIGLTFLLLITAIIFAARQLYRPCLIACGAACGVLFFSSFPPLLHVLVRSLEKRYDQKEQYPAVPAIVLLSGGEVPRIEPRIFDEFNSSGDRIAHAVRLYRKGFAPVIVATGGKIGFLKEYEGTESEVQYRLLTGLYGIDSASVLVEDKARNTRENGVFVRKLMDGRGMKPEVILVTSAMHMPRSVAVFRKLGFTVYPAPCDFAEDAKFQWKLFWLFPNEDAMAKMRSFLHELYGMIAYRIFGWI